MGGFRNTRQHDAKRRPVHVLQRRQPLAHATQTLSPFPEGPVTQEQGEAYCRLICETYPEVFNGEKGHFRGAEATIFIKDGHMDSLKRVGVRPAGKVPFGLESQYEAALDELYEDLVPISGHELITAIQVVPVCQVVDGRK